MALIFVLLTIVMKMIVVGFKMMALLLLGAGMAISCIDNSYDLDDVRLHARR